MPCHKLKWVILIFAFLFGVAGCIDGQARNFVRYDAATDSFHFLDIYTNIASKEPEELAYIADLWSRRNDLVVNLLPKLELFSSPKIWERDGNHKYNLVPIADPTNSLTSATTKADLSKITVKPGEFFRNEHGNLCYYHENTVPGAVVDAVLLDASHVVSNLLAEFAEHQIASAAKTDERVTWDQLREFMASSLEGTSSEKPQSAPLPLDRNSLRMMIKAGLDKSIEITRQRDEFSLKIPLSEADCRQVIATYELARELLPSAKNAPKDLRDIFTAINVQKTGNHALTLTISLSKLTPLMLKNQRDMPAPSANVGTTYRTTIASLRGNGIPVASENMFPKLVQQFETDANNGMSK